MRNRFGNFLVRSKSVNFSFFILGQQDAPRGLENGDFEGSKVNGVMQNALFSKLKITSQKVRNSRAEEKSRIFRKLSKNVCFSENRMMIFQKQAILVTKLCPSESSTRILICTKSQGGQISCQMQNRLVEPTGTPSGTDPAPNNELE